MTAVFRSCLPRFYSNTNQSISSEHLSNKTNSIISFDNNNSMDCSPIITNPTSLEQKQTKISRSKKRGPRFSRIHEKPQPLFTRLVGTIFGEYGSHEVPSKTNRRTKRTKKSILPSTTTVKKQFEKNEQTLRSLVTLLTQIESKVKLTTTETLNETQQESSNEILPIQTEQARNNNRMDDTSSSHSNDSYHHQKTIGYKSKDKHNHQHSTSSKRYKKTHLNNKKRGSEENSISSTSIISHYLSQSSPIMRKKMVDNQQQTQLNPTKINIGTSTQFNNTNENTTSEPSWFDVMREDQTTINAWARIRRRLKPNQQKDILRALMIICANLFEVPIENKHI